MVHQWEYDNLAKAIDQKNDEIRRIRARVQRLENLLRSWAMRLNENDPMTASIMLDDLIDAR